MGQSQSYTPNGVHATTTTTNFEQAEQAAFEHVKEALRDMRFCCREDLEQAAFSYYAEGLRLAGVQFREEYARRKAARFADWWDQKHSASRTPRPHTKYSESQALRGRQVAAMRKTNRNDWTALQVQLARQGGVKVAEVAELVGCSARNIYKLSRRRFPRLVALVLALALGVNVGNSSGGKALPQRLVDTPKEGLRSGTLAPSTAAKLPAHPRPVGKIDDLDAIAAAIPDLLRGHWASQGL